MTITTVMFLSTITSVAILIYALKSNVLNTLDSYIDNIQKRNKEILDNYNKSLQNDISSETKLYQLESIIAANLKDFEDRLELLNDEFNKKKNEYEENINNDFKMSCKNLESIYNKKLTKQIADNFIANIKNDSKFQLEIHNEILNKVNKVKFL